MTTPSVWDILIFMGTKRYISGASLCWLSFELRIGDKVTVKAHWNGKQPTECEIVGFWSKDGPFLDVKTLDSCLVKCVRRDDIIN